MSNLGLSSVRTYKEILQNTVSSVSLRKAWHEAFWVFVGQAGTAIGGLIGVKLLTHVLIPAEYGKLALANTIVALIGINLFGPFANGLMRFWGIARANKSLGNFYTISNYYARYLSILTFFIAILVFTIIIFINSKINWAVLIFLALIIGIFHGLSNIRLRIFTAARQRCRVALLSISIAILKPLLAFLLVNLIVENVIIALFGYFFAILFVWLIIEFQFSRMTTKISSIPRLKFKKILFKGLGKEISLFSSKLLILSTFSWIKAYSERWALMVFCGSETVGTFGIVSLSATFILSQFSNFLTTLFNPIAYQRGGAINNNKLITSGRKILSIMISIYIIGIIILVGLFTVFHRPLIGLISNERFVKFSYLLPGLTGILGFYQLGEMIASFGAFSLLLRSFIIAKIVSSLVAGIFTFYFASKFGPVGILLGYAFAGFVYTPWCAINAKKSINYLQQNLK